MRRTELKRTGGLSRSSGLTSKSSSRSDNGKRAAAKAKRERRDRRIADDAAWRDAVAQRDGRRCRCCGRRGHQAHHAAQRSTHPAYKHDVEVGLFLCLTCHQWAHEVAPFRDAVARGLLVPASVQERSAVLAAIGPRGECRCHG